VAAADSEAARKLWDKLHREGICTHDPHRFHECPRFDDELKHLANHNTKENT
jgi:hypothetical protein